MVCFQMERYMFEHVFQDLKAVKDGIALFFSGVPSELCSDECLTYAHNHLYQTVNCLEQVATDSVIGGISLKSDRHVLIAADSQLWCVYSLHRF